MKLSFEHRSETVEFTVSYRKRKTLGIEVRPPGVVTVAVPMGTSKDRIMSAVLGKADWILQKRDQMRILSENNAEPETYKEGSPVQFLGKGRVIKILEDPNYDIPAIQLEEDCIEVLTASPHEDIVRNAVEKWRSQITKQHLENRIEYYQQYFNQTPSRIIIKEQKRRWGSCNSDRELRFNKHCMKASERAIDYLVVHEMSHMVHMNHSKAFWDHVEKIMPDYKTARAELKKTMI